MKEQLAQLKGRLDTLEQGLNRIDLSLQLSNRQNQLQVPIDPTTQRIITDLIVFPVSFKAPGTSAATAGNYSVFFQADRPVGILSVAEVHTTAGSDGSAVTLQLEKLTGTTVPGSGTAVLTATLNLKGTANTPQYGSISAASGVNALVRGDRLAAKLVGTPTAVANVVLTVFLKPL